MTRILGEYGHRIDDFLDAKEAADLATQRAARAYSPSSQDSRLSATSDDAEIDCAGVNGTQSPNEDDDDDSFTESAESADSVEGILRMDILNLLHHDDDEEESLPLVDLWFDLDQHLSEGDIPSPHDLYKEWDAAAKYVRLLLAYTLR